MLKLQILNSINKYLLGTLPWKVYVQTFPYLNSLCDTPCLGTLTPWLTEVGILGGEGHYSNCHCCAWLAVWILLRGFPHGTDECHICNAYRVVQEFNRMFKTSMSRRVKAIILYATETGRSATCAKKVGELFSNSFNFQVSCPKHCHPSNMHARMHAPTCMHITLCVRLVLFFSSLLCMQVTKYIEMYRGWL